MKILLDITKIIRVQNCLLSAAGVAIGARMTWVDPAYYAPMMAAIATFLVCAFGNVINDLLDIEVDRISHPDRPLAADRMSPRFALVIAILSGCFAIIAAYSSGTEVLATVIGAMLLLVAYNYKLKRWPLAGNLAVAVLSGMTFLVGGLAIDSTLALTMPGPLVPAILAFSFHLVREIIKDVEDIEGDQQKGYRSLPIIMGRSKTMLVVLALFVLLIGFALVPVWQGWFSRVYEILAIYVVLLPTLAFLIFVWANPVQKMVRTASTVLKVGMIIGLVGILAGLN